ncbi:RHS repeat-associated core domain-containing protein [Paraburkholderia polaris]
MGLPYYKARMYLPALGRFLQTDPVGTADDLNLYAYVANNPINFTDPSGLAAASARTFNYSPLGGATAFASLRLALVVARRLQWGRCCRSSVSG